MVREGERAGGQTLSLAFAESQTRAYPILPDGRTVRRRTDWPTNELLARPAGWLAANKPLITLLGEHRADVEKLKREQGLPYEVRGGLLDLKLAESSGIVISYSTLGF